MVGFGVIEAIVFVIMLGSGGLGVPLGMPPGPEHPMLGRFAPENPEVFIAWTGSEKPGGDDPTSKWMANPEIQATVAKVMAGLSKLAPEPDENESEADVLQRLVFKSVETSLYQGGSMFASGIQLNRRQPKFDAAMLIPLGDRALEFQQLVAALESASQRSTDPLCRFDAQQGETKVIIEQELAVELMVKDDFLVIGINAGMLDQGLKNMQSDPPPWFTDARERLTMGKFSSMSFLSSKCLRDIELPIDPFFDVRALESMCFVSGIDDGGAVTRSSIQFRAGSELETLLPSKPLTENELMRLPPRPLIGFETTIPVDAVVEFIANVGKQVGDDPLIEAEEQVQDLFGMSLKDELLHFFDGGVGVSIDVDIAGNRPQVMAVFGIKDEMSFPAIYQTVVDAICKWPEVEDRLEKIEHREYEIYEFSPQQRFVPIGVSWAHINDQLVIASSAELVAQQVDRTLDGGGFAKTKRAQQLIAFGKESGLGNPVMVTSMDPVKLMEIYLQFVSMWGRIDDAELLPGFTLGDLPELEVLSAGVDSSVNGIYRSKTGVETYGRTTLPGSSPPVSAVAVAGVAGVRLAPIKRQAKREINAQNSMRQIILASLNFESANLAFPATATVDADGKPLLSWRVHILPFLEQNELYEKFHLDESWDSEHNKTLIKEMPNIYCHKDMKAADGKTVYLGVAGEDGVLGTPQKKPPGEIGFGQITDGSSNTLMAVAVEPSSAVIWSRPVDLDTADGGEKVIEVTDENEDSTVIGFCDGSVRSTGDLDAEDWILLMDIADGEVLDIEALVK